MLEYKVDKGSAGKLMLISMFKTIFPRRTSGDPDRSINTKVVSTVYKKSCMQQLGPCRVKIMQKSLNAM